MMRTILQDFRLILKIEDMNAENTKLKFYIPNDHRILPSTEGRRGYIILMLVT